MFITMVFGAALYAREVERREVERREVERREVERREVERREVERREVERREVERREVERRDFLVGIVALYCSLQKRCAPHGCGEHGDTPVPSIHLSFSRQREHLLRERIVESHEHRDGASRLAKGRATGTLGEAARAPTPTLATREASRHRVKFRVARATS